MIISASYRTDIPAFYGEWFRNRFRAGWRKVVNPYGRQVQTVPLREGVDGFVFWTRNAAPFAPVLAELRQADVPFVVQYIVTSLTLDWHRETFRRLAAALDGAATDEVVVSFTQIYRKTGRNLTLSARAHGFTWNSPTDEEKRTLAEDLASAARRHGMTLTLCTQPDLASASLPPQRRRRLCSTQPALETMTENARQALSVSFAIKDYAALRRFKPAAPTRPAAKSARDIGSETELTGPPPT